MKHTSWLTYICLITPFLVTSQILEMPELPNVIPPSPTVANLMAFEEVPVDNYTGTPNISVPIYQTTGYSGYAIGVSISYNPSGIAVDNISSWMVLECRWCNFKNSLWKTR